MPTPKISWNQRSDLAHILNDRGLLGIGVEVGVQTGYNAEQIRSTWKGELLIGVDPWRPYGTDVTDAMHEEYAQLAMKRLRATDKGFALFRMESLVAVDFLNGLLRAAPKQSVADCDPEPPLDFVYLDGDHSYEAVKADIRAWWPLIKSGGILAGHDWVVDGWHRHGQPYEAVSEALGAETGPGPFYVRKAVREIFRDEDIAVTAPETDMGWQSWAVVKP